MIQQVIRALVVVALLVSWPLPSVLAVGEPTITITSPTAGSQVTTTDIQVRVSVANFTLDCLKAGLPDEPGVGHLLALLDGTSMAKLANLACSNTFTISGQGLQPGSHKLIVMLATNTHVDLVNTEQEVSFDYEPTSPPPALPAPTIGTPSAQITGLVDGATVGPTFGFSVVPINFQPSGALAGKPNIAGWGHYLIGIDMPPANSAGGMGSLAGMVSMPGTNNVSVDLSKWTSGKHTLTLQITNDDHTPYADVQPVVLNFTLNNPAVRATRTAKAPSQLPSTGGAPDAPPAALVVSLLLVVTGLGVRHVGRST
jgi:hypothetical protein